MEETSKFVGIVVVISVIAIGLIIALSPFILLGIGLLGGLNFGTD